MCLFFRRNVSLRDRSSLELQGGPRPASRYSFSSAKLPFSVSTTPSSSRRSSLAPGGGLTPSVSHLDMPRRDMYEALDAIAEALPDMPHAVIGGLALMLLGSSRATKDIDIVVPDGRGDEAAALLAAEGFFGTETTINGKRRVWFDASSNHRYNVDVMEPRSIGQVFDDGVPETRTVQGHKVLDPAQLLNFKIASWTDRMKSQSTKKANHAKDIVFLAEYLAKKGIIATRGDVTHATDEFLMLFNASYPGSSKLFDRIGLVRTGASRKGSVDSRFFKQDDWF